MANVSATPYGKLTRPDLRQLDGPFRRFLTKVAITIQIAARLKAPSDMGQLKNSIQISLDPSVPPIWAKVGSALKTARYMEYGTGLLSDAPDSKHQRHFPPGKALDVWARRHGIAGGGYAVAKAIGKRGGLKPRRFFRGALAETKTQIPGFVRQLDSDVKAIWQK